MFTGGHCHSRAIPSAPPPRRKRPRSSRYAVPPLLNYPPPPQNLLLLVLLLPQPCGGFFLRAYFRGDGARRKKIKIVCGLKVICYLTHVRIDSNNNSSNNQTTKQPTIMRHYYALSDSYTGPNPAEYTSGFASTSAAIAFDSLSKRTAWLAATRLLKARAINRPEAIKLTPALKAPAYLKGLKVLPLWDTDATGRAGVAHTGGVVTLQESRW